MSFDEPNVSDKSIQPREPIRHSKFHYTMSVAYKCFVVYTFKKLMIDLNK